MPGRTRLPWPHTKPTMPIYTVTLIETTHNDVSFHADSLEHAKAMIAEGMDVDSSTFKFVSSAEFQNDVREGE